MKNIYLYSTNDIRKTLAGVFSDISADITEERAFALRLVLSELLTNSLVHSGCTRTLLSYELMDDLISCIIKDDGEWFSMRNITCSDVQRSSGRGVFLANHYAESLLYDDELKRITVTVKINKK